jgi:nucleotide-binding universal stress UspA family protein
MAALPRAHLAHFPSDVRNVLVVTSALLDAQATAAALSAMHSSEPVRIHLLAVESKPTGYARSFLERVDIERVQDGEAHRHAAPLCEALEDSGVPYRVHVARGPWLESIERYARELGCTRVVVGDNPQRSLYRLVLRHDRWRIESYLRGQGLRCATFNASLP